MKNQPSPSLISLSPLFASHPRALRRSWVRSSGLTPVDLLANRSLGFGRDANAIKQLTPTCWPIIQKVRGRQSQQPADCLFNYFNAFKSPCPGSLSAFLHSTNILSFTLQIIPLEIDLYIQRNKAHLLKQRKNFATIPPKSLAVIKKELVQSKLLTLLLLFDFSLATTKWILYCVFTVAKKMFQLTTLVSMVCNFSQNIVIFLNGARRLRFVHHMRLSAWAVFIRG